MHRLMLELRMASGNAKALAYGYLVAMDFDPSQGIVIDFTGYKVTLKGRHLRPLFMALAAHRVSNIQEIEELHAEATLSKEATVVTSIKVEALA